MMYMVGKEEKAEYLSLFPYYVNNSCFRQGFSSRQRKTISKILSDFFQNEISFNDAQDPQFLIHPRILR